jgi:hypothetical protein
MSKYTTKKNQLKKDKKTRVNWIKLLNQRLQS